MRRFTPFILSTVSVAALAATPAFGQTNAQQQQAQQQNTQVDCSTVTDPAAHATCVQTQGQNAPATAGAPEAGAIVVTGSRIPKPNYDTVQPAVVLTSQAIEQRGFVNAADALNELPQFGIPGSSPVGAGQAGAFGTGQSFVNFLGLGSQRTLVLVNGRRFISSNTASIFGPSSAGEQVDLGLINTKLIDRIETIAIGGAPIYGSDAIAGTINVILKHDYEGIDIDGENGISKEGDAHNWRVRALAGHNFLDGRANLTASAEYNKGDGFTYNDRALFRRGLFYDNCPPDSQFTQCLYENGPRVNSVYQGGAPVVGADLVPLSPEQMEALIGLPGFIPGLGRTTFGVTDANGNDVAFDLSGNLIPIDYGVNPGGAGDLFSAGGNGFAYIRDTSQALSDTERYNANLIGHFDVTDNIRLFAEGWYSHSKSTNLATQPEYNSGIFDVAGAPAGNLLLSVNNPFLTADQRALIENSIENNPFSDRNLLCTLAGVDCGADRPTQDYFYLSRANTDIPTGRSTFTDTVYRVVGGVNGKFNLFAGPWNWEVVGNYGHSHAIGRTVDINTQNFFNALGTITADNPNGVPCLPGLANSPFPTRSSTCAPFNPFGSGRASQESLDYILSNIENVSNNKQFVFTADMSGPLFRLPGGDFSAAVGVEHRAESTDAVPDAFYHGPDPDPTVDENGDGDPTNDVISYGQTVPIIPISGKFHTNEVFGELDADIISPANNIPMIHSLDVQAAARYVDHSVAGGDITWTVGSRYAPVRDISFRGNFTHAIRAPAIQEAFVPTSTFFGFATDPCDFRNSGSGPDPATRQANCLAEGIDPSTFVSQAGSRSFLQSTGGNPDLKNEKSDAYSIGAVATPTFIPRLSLSVDYINVKLKDAISNFTATQVLDACYDAPSPASNPFCDLFTRNAAHQITFVKTSFFNAAELHYRGVVASWDYRMNTPFLGSSSTLGLSGSYQHLIELTSTPNPGAAESHNEGTLGYPKDSFTATLNYLNGPVSLFTNFNYTGPVNQGVDEPKDFREHQRLGSFLVVNGGATIEVNHRFRFFFDVDNIFNRKPPFPVPAFGGAVTYFPGVLGRYYRFGAGVHF
jgi:outer membrane receptor protein involved in Fe transport